MQCFSFRILMDDHKDERQIRIGRGMSLTAPIVADSSILWHLGNSSNEKMLQMKNRMFPVQI